MPVTMMVPCLIRVLHFWFMLFFNLTHTHLTGINLSCNKNQSTPGSPRHSSGRLSPTSDFVEDSVSEDNNSSVNSTSEQSSIYSSDSSPQHRSINGLQYPAPQNLSLNNRGGGKSSGHQNPPKSPVVVEFKPVATGYNTTVLTYTSNGSTHSPPSSNSSSSSWPSSTPIHFHKKYLREEHMKQIKQEMEISEEPQNLSSSPVNYR